MKLKYDLAANAKHLALVPIDASKTIPVGTEIILGDEPLTVVGSPTYSADCTLVPVRRTKEAAYPAGTEFGVELVDRESPEDQEEDDPEPDAD